MKLALDAMPVAVAWIRLSDGHSEFMNQRYVELFGYSQLDGFKELNDTCGHAAGDELIVRFARILESSVRADDLIARWGGDEFAVLMQPPVSGDMIAGIVARLNEALSEPWVVDGISRTISVSAGWATRPEDALSPSDLLRVADAVMYRAKKFHKGWQSSGRPTNG